MCARAACVSVSVDMADTHTHKSAFTGWNRRIKKAPPPSPYTHVL